MWRSGKDQFTLIAIRRVMLDAFWSREPSTVGANWRRARADYLSTTNMLSIKDFLPVLGWAIVEDRVGLASALMTIITSLREGINTENIITIIRCWAATGQNKLSATARRMEFSTLEQGKEQG